jgi:hypothetical protein
MDSDRRRHERRLASAEAQMADLMGRSWLPIRLIDISEGGIAFTTEEEIEIGDVRSIAFVLPGDGKRIDCEVRIANLMAIRPVDELSGKYRLGASFESLIDDQRYRIRRFVEDSA